MWWLLLACDPPSVEGVPDDVPTPDTSVEAVPGVEQGLCVMDLACDQAIQDEPKVPCTLSVHDAQGTAHYDGSAGVERRGRSSGAFPKPQYAVELWDPDGEAVSENLLGMGGDSDWVLNGAYIDRAFVRNKLGYDLFVEFGGWAAESRACTLELNGDPQGIYFLVERVKSDDDRIALEDGFVHKLDDQAGLLDWSAVGHGSWRMVSPADPSAADVQDATDWLAGWRADVGTDAQWDWIDRDSAIDFVLLQEFMKNNDAYYLSVHVWQERGEPLRFTPWDLDLTLGQPTYNDNVSPEGWVLYRPAWVPEEDMTERWWALREGPLSEGAVMARLEAQLAEVEPAVQENYAIWDWDEIDFLDGTLPVVEDHATEVDNIRAWIPARLAWMDANIEDY